MPADKCAAELLAQMQHITSAVSKDDGVRKLYQQHLNTNMG